MPPTEFNLNTLFKKEPYGETHAWQKSWAAVGLVFRPEKDDLELLFIERSKNPRDSWSGQMAFPGGRREPGETIIQTAQREIKEEVGLDLKVGTQFLGYLLPLQVYKKGQPQDFSLMPTGFLMSKNQSLKLDQTEVAEAYWISLRWLLDHTNHSFFTYSIEERSLQMPCIPLQSNKIWGLTYKILAEISERITKP